MSKYEYRFCVYKNNMRDGIYYVRSFKTLREALRNKREIEMGKGGCCDVVKKKFVIGANEPITSNIYNNYRYQDYDL